MRLRSGAFLRPPWRPRTCLYMPIPVGSAAPTRIICEISLCPGSSAPVERAQPRGWPVRRRGGVARRDQLRVRTGQKKLLQPVSRCGVEEVKLGLIKRYPHFSLHVEAHRRIGAHDDFSVAEIQGGEGLVAQRLCYVDSGWDAFGKL